MLAAQARGSGNASGEVCAGQPGDEGGDLPKLLSVERGPELGGDARDGWLIHVRVGEIEILEETVQDAPAQAPAGTLAVLLGKTEDAFEVVAIAAALELGESGVAESELGM